MLEFHLLFLELCTLSISSQIHNLHNKHIRVFWCCSDAKILMGYNQYFENIKVNSYFRFDGKHFKILTLIISSSCNKFSDLKIGSL